MRDLESQLSSKDNTHRPSSYRKSLIFFRGRVCRFFTQNGKILFIAGSILCILFYLYLFNVKLENGQSMHLNYNNNKPVASPHLYVQNPIFFDDIITNKRRIQKDINNNVDDSVIDYSTMSDLIIVAGHAVYSHHSYKECLDPMHWRLLQHQRKGNHLSAFLEHIAVGIKLTYNNPSALLMFSGGSTRTEVGPFSEGAAYWKVAQNCDYDEFKHFKFIEKRAFTEEYAMDSFQNILFSICRFYEITGKYPKRITAISWSYKKTRFEKLHRKALMFPKDEFTFLGVDGYVNITENAWKYEKTAIEMFKQDLFGCYLKLKETRIKRNPYFRSLPYPHQCPHLKQLFNICADSQGLGVLPLKLPWT